MMGIDEVWRDVAKATVRLPSRGGQGVLVPGNVIVTAAHCIEWSCEGGMVLGDHYIEEIECAGRTLRASPLALEPLSDTAALGALDSQTFAQEAEEFDDFCASTRPVSVCTSTFEMFKPFPVWILTHKGDWIGARATQCNESSRSLYVEADQQIEGGTSGGPVIDEKGLLLGVVSNFCEARSGQGCDGHVSRLHLALPNWLVMTVRGERRG